MHLLFHTLILPLLLVIYVAGVRKAFAPLKRTLLDVAVIAATCVVMVIAIMPPAQKIKLGRDLRGGVSLIYSVNMPAGSDSATKSELLKQTIKTLKNRVNPQGVLDLTMTPQGEDRIEVVMPLPGDEVRVSQKAYTDALDALLAKARLTPRELNTALAEGKAVDLAKGDATRAAELTKLQSLWSAARDGRAAYDAAIAAGKQGADLDASAEAAATAEVAYDEQRAKVQTGALTSSRWTRVVALPQLAKKGEDRAAAVAQLKTEFPSAVTEIDAALVNYDAYAALRTVLDDPEDLKRLLRGAGVLDFHIAVTTQNSLGVNVEELRKQLAQGGPLAAESPVARWFKINSIDEWANTPAQREALEANPAGFFASSRGLTAGTGPDKSIYILLWITPDRSLTHEPGGKEWSMKRVGRTSDELGRVAVSFELDDSGGVEMGRLTGANVAQPMAIVLDNQVYTAPNLNTKINDRGQISGNFSEKEIDYLVRVLASGSLGARLSPEPVSVSVLGPAMGKDNLQRGLNSVLISVPATFAIMALYYFIPGIIANISLLVNALIIFYAMSLVDASFTLPGLAGIALNLGIAVDSNVLIYERLREELVDRKQPLLDAIDTAMRRARTAIIDGNMTHLIVVVVLYWFAGSEVKGFALVMGIGVFSTLAAGLIVTQVLLRLYALGLNAKTMPMLPIVVPAISRALHPSIDWLRYRFIFWGGAIVVAIICISATLGRGSDIFETEFRGGTTMTMATRAARPGEDAFGGHLAMARSAVEERLHALGAANSADPVLAELRNSTVLTVGETNAALESSAFQIKVPNPSGVSEDTPIANILVSAVVEAFKDDMDIRRPVKFAGLGVAASAGHSFRIDRPGLGEVIGRPTLDYPTDSAIGGVAIVVTDVEPPLVPADALERIRRMRSSPAFAEAGGRSVDVVGLDAAGNGTFKSLAIVVADPDLAGAQLSDVAWQKNYADLEWNLISSALSQQASLEQVSSISPSVARDLASQATLAVLLSCVGMLVYIWIRFGSLLYSVATVIGVVFNISVCLGMLAMSKWIGDTQFGHFLHVQDFRIDLNVVAALLVVIGYSLNDTIVILDRVRENRGKLAHASRSIINESLNQTFSRTLLTGGCTAATPIVLYLVGGPSMQPFAFTFFVGLVAGTFSSVAIAAPLVYVPGDGTPETDGAASRALASPASA